MELNNDVEVNAPISEVWAAFNDVERIAPCLPGAQLQEVEGDEYRGIVKVKVGPITAQYKGAATFIEQNELERRVVIKGDGRDTRGAGNASALITATLDQVSDTVTKVNVHTDLTITGKVAQFGRGAIADVSSKLMGQFADNLETLLSAPAAVSDSESPAVPAAASAIDDATNAPAEPTVRKINSPEPEAVDLLEIAGTPLLKRLALPVGLILLLLLVRRLMGSRGESAVAAPMTGRPSVGDVEAVAALLGRPPQGSFEVVVRDKDGRPRVIRNAAFLDDGTPMPTRFWLVSELDRLLVSRLESAGAVSEAERAVGAEAIADAHARYAAERESTIPADHQGPRPSGGVAGTRQGCKCLHAHYAWYLAGGDDPVGRWVAERLANPADSSRPATTA